MPAAFSVATIRSALFIDVGVLCGRPLSHGCFRLLKGPLHAIQFCHRAGDNDMAGLLAAVRVLDLTNVLAGPFCCYQLAQLGAEVIKVEAPGTGDLARQLGADAELNRRLMGASFLAQNAGKRSITLSLKNPRGREAFTRLVATADVVVENFRPGVMERLALDYPMLKAIKPDLIYCAISGFGQDGPLKSNPAYDQIIQGLSGVMSVTGDARSAPLRVGYPVADTMGGITAAYAIAGALFRRERTGEGEFIDVSMLESTLVAMGWVVSNWLIAGVRPQPWGNENMTASPSGTFRTGDGLLNIAANQQQQFETLCSLLGQPELARDPRFAGREERKRHRFELSREIEQALLPRSAAEWAALLNDNGVPAGAVLDVPSALEHPQVAERKLLRRFERVPGVGRAISVVRSGFRLGSGDPAPASPPPALGADTDRVLDGLGYSKDEIDALRREQVI
jgi:crotonobetainyl-CoA:carnitine CoA-transferase CaiB-like acyl-CoA transferase